ncbi:MAG TPA: hypothetical protein VEY30_12595 [Myxococcaceae bacterium]|nr:hypothetical protein [Myxococcaceae bacterium]
MVVGFARWVALLCAAGLAWSCSGEDHLVGELKPTQVLPSPLPGQEPPEGPGPAPNPTPVEPLPPPAVPVCGNEVFCAVAPMPEAGILKDTWGLSADDFWAVGPEGVALRWNGTQWNTAATVTGVRLSGLWGTSAQDVWAVGTGVLHWDGAAWSREPIQSAHLYDIAGSSDGALWAVGERGAVVRRQAGTWEAVPSGTTVDLFSVWPFAADDVWAGGQLGTVLHWNGVVWESRAPETAGFTVSAFWGFAPNDLWAATEGGNLFHWDGTAWSLAFQEPTSAPAYFALWGAGPDSLWAVGAGKVLRRTVSGWQAAPVQGGITLLGLWGSADQLWAVGYEGSAYVRRGP